METRRQTLGIRLFLFLGLLCLLSVAWDFALSSPLPDSLACKVQPFYRRRPDGKPGREVMVYFKGTGLRSAATLEIRAGELRETRALSVPAGGLDSAAVLLPADVGVNKEASITFVLRRGVQSIEKSVQVPAMRHWTVYVYPHSHVDIGYSNTHANVEYIHKGNIDYAIALADSTRNFPPGSSYRWNTEVLWPFERYWKSATPDKVQRLVKAVQRGQICLDASYVHLLTSTLGDEETMQALRIKREAEALTGKTIDTYVQVDVPGMAWGLVPVFAHEGVRYVMLMPNGGRGNPAMVNLFDHKPFWWEGPDGTSKVLFLHAGGYGAGMEKGGKTGRPWFGQRDRAKIPPAIRTDNPRDNFLDHHLFKALPDLEAAKYPYDMYVVTWAMWDNALQDADLPYAVKSWNQDYAYPHLVIASAHEIMQTFEQRYGDALPIVKGDFSEYWNDGLGTVAREAKANRNAKERLVQAETLWPMLRPEAAMPRVEFDEAWRNVVMCSEHTFTYENPNEPYFQDAIWKMKQRYFQEAEERSQTLFDDALAPATDKSNGALGPVEGPSKGGIAVFNTHSWSHGGLVTLARAESQTGNKVVDDQGREIPSQRLSTGVLAFLASDVPAFGSRHYRVVKGENYRGSPLMAADTLLDNGKVRVVLDRKSGNIVHLIERATGREFVDATANLGMNAFRWMPARGAGDARPDTVVSMTVSESGPLVGEIQVISKAPGCRSVRRSVRLVAGQTSVEISNIVDKLPLLPKDGVHFGFSFALPHATTRVDIPWSIMRVEQDQWPAANRAWMSTQHFVDISNESNGATWCSLDAPLIESGTITANNTADWDGKGDVWPSRLDPSSTIYSWVMNNHWFTNTPLTQDGPVEFRYRVLLHGPYDAAAAYRFGVEQSQPLVSLAANTTPSALAPIMMKNDRVAATILKSTGDGKGMIVRLRSLSDNAETVNLSWPARAPRMVRICDKGETPGAREAKEAVSVPAKGFVTLYVTW
jgi:alpha-mannosidase